MAIGMAADLSDIELMLSLKNGETQYLDPLFKRHRNSVFHFLHRKVQNAAVAEELAQDVFLKVYRAKGNYEPSAHFTTWLYRIAANRAINWVRDNHHDRESISLDQMVVPHAAPGATPEQELLRRENRRRIREAVAALPERQREAVFLHKFRELEYVQIAEVMGCSVSAIKALLNRAYFSLRRSLAPN